MQGDGGRLPKASETAAKLARGTAQAALVVLGEADGAKF